MTSILSIEVYGIIIPTSLLLLFFLLPIPFLYKLVSKLVNSIEGFNFYGMTPFLALGLAALIGFAVDMQSMKTMGSSSGFHDISLVLKAENKKLRVERNLYIHACVCILCLSIKKIASLNLKLLTNNKEKVKSKKD